MKVLAAFWPFRPSRAERDADKLVGVVTQISRQPSFYGAGRVPDTLEGRLEIMTLHAALAFIRMGAEAGATPLSQVFADKLFRHIDSGLREAGVGDLTVPKRMRKIASSFYGRLDAYANALKAGDRGELAAALARNVFAMDASGAPFAGTLGAYAAANVEKQASASLDTLFRLDGWAPAPV